MRLLDVSRPALSRPALSRRGGRCVGPAALVVAVLATAACGAPDAEPIASSRTGGAAVVVEDVGVQAGVDELVFNAVHGQRAAAQTVTLINTTRVGRPISAVTLDGDAAAAFTVAGFTGPLYLPPGGSLALRVDFGPSADAVGQLAAGLTAETGTGPVRVGLYGLATAGTDGSREPTLTNVLSTVGHPANVGSARLKIGTGDGALGAEITSPLFTALPGTTVSLRPIARFTPDESLPFGWYEPAIAPVQHQVGVIAAGQNQALNPAMIDPADPAGLDPGAAPFGIYVHSNTFGRDTFSQDALNTGPTRHAVRVFPAADRGGWPIEGAYVLAVEDFSNGDYQDYVFLLSGVHPVRPS